MFDDGTIAFDGLKISLTMLYNPKIFEVYVGTVKLL